MACGGDSVDNSVSTSEDIMPEPTEQIETTGTTPQEGTTLTSPEIVKADKAWEQGFYGYNVLIGIIDSGARATHSSFSSGRMRTDLGYNFDALVATTTDPLSGDGHGTSVASIAIGSKASRIGVAPKAEAIPLRTCLSSCISKFGNKQFKDAFSWAHTQGAKVINYSLYTPFGSTDMSPDENDPLFDALVASGTNNIVVVFAAGNNSDTSGPVQPARNVDEEHYGGNLIAVGNVIVDSETGKVTGLDPTSNHAGIAKHKYIVAPGSSKAARHTSDTEYHYVNGTSFAAPLVAGAAAIIREAYPVLTAAQVIQILLKSADDLGDSGVDAVYGHGMLNIDKALTLAATY